ncbi:hypothetical protein HDU97_008959 [Phlyctochytrium planicorne]|nr:hypothetical protein HDU97_008959 [Phlyctochytrium planicorne]
MFLRACRCARLLSTLPKGNSIGPQPKLGEASLDPPSLPAEGITDGSRGNAPRTRQEIVLNELDLEEKFVKGSGPGGQKINKSSSCVQLRHIPTNISIECQRFRDLTSNRREARKLLVLKLDELVNKDLSKVAVKAAKEQKRKKKKAQRAQKKYEKGREDEDEREEGEEDGEAGNGGSGEGGKVK